MLEDWQTGGFSPFESFPFSFKQQSALSNAASSTVYWKQFSWEIRVCSPFNVRPWKRRQIAAIQLFRPRASDEAHWAAHKSSLPRPARTPTAHSSLAVPTRERGEQGADRSSCSGLRLFPTFPPRKTTRFPFYSTPILFVFLYTYDKLVRILGVTMQFSVFQ